MTFFSFYAQPSCTPGRTAMQTGRIPNRSGMTTVAFQGQDGGLPAAEWTLASVLKQGGYQTYFTASCRSRCGAAMCSPTSRAATKMKRSLSRAASDRTSSTAQIGWRRRLVSTGGLRMDCERLGVKRASGGTLKSNVLAKASPTMQTYEDSLAHIRHRRPTSASH